MADIYVRSTDGLDTKDGTNWSQAKATLTGAAAIDNVGDRIFVSQSHAETAAVAVTISLNGNSADPTFLLCGSDALAPPTSSTESATVTTTGASSLSISGSCYAHGFVFSAGSGNNTLSLTLAAASIAAETQHYGSCTFRLGTTSTSTQQLLIGLGTSTSQKKVVWENCNVNFAGTGNRIAVNGFFEWRGGAFEVGTESPTAGAFGVFFCGGTGANSAAIGAIISGVDFSALSPSINLVQASSYKGSFVFRNCRLPTGWSGKLATPATPGFRVDMHNCDSGDTNYRLLVEDYSGSIASETSRVRNGGASDGLTQISWNMSTNTRPKYPITALVSTEVVVWNDTIGAAKTITVEVMTDGVTLKDDECWLEVQHLGTAGYPLGMFASDAKPDVLATASDQSTSTETWTTTGMTMPVTQKLSVTFTPQGKGFVHAKVMLAKPSTTVYVCPKASVT